MVVFKRAAGVFSVAILSLPRIAAAQDFNFNILPLAINSAFTGLFDGQLRANGIYKRHWSSAKASLNAYGMSADAVLARQAGGYLAAGLGFLESRTDNNTLNNFSGIASVAYHKTIARTTKHRGDFGLGLQGGYINRNLNLIDFSNSVAPYIYHIGAGAQYFIVNAGISFSQVIAPRLTYTFGLSGNNLNLLNDGTVPVENPLLKVVPTYTGLLTINWNMTSKMTLRPAILYIINQGFYVTGGEIRCRYNAKKPLNTAYLATWYRSGNVITINPGYEFGHFRIGTGIEYNLSHSDLLHEGGIQLNARYIIPSKAPKKAKK
jgi:type IX secretion system PorP/SprF family membrane protein